MSNGDGPTVQQRDPWLAVRHFLGAPDEEIEAVIQALGEPLLGRDALVSAIQGAAPSLNRRLINEALGAILGYIGGWLGAGSPGSQAIEDLAAQRTYPDDEEGALREKARRLISRPAISMAAGALHAAQTRGQFVSQVSIGLDLTPIDWSGGPGAAVLPTFPLVIDSYVPTAPDTEERVSVALDITDLRSLRDAVDAALLRAQALQEKLESAGILMWNLTEEEEREETPE
ncbi:hypothetical protein [Microbacterium sp. JZ31]|uniref:hypothetical protein n=1 Tax=Microbacterium sp. JZ31 TaxID=1906274 RepID=UPI001931A9ED|nr:hypothetical protein [Microbacterium sp. JZ31]